jgi:hypothetical protein
MPRIHGRKPVLAVALVCAAVAAAALETLGRSAQAVPKGEKARPKDPVALIYYSSEACKDCHNQNKPREDKDNPPICRCTEWSVFASLDKHGIAHQVLLGKRGVEIARALDIKDVGNAPGCVSCHSVRLAKPAEGVVLEARPAEGVSCVACHGANRIVDNVGWVERHSSRFAAVRKAWRKLARADKEEKYGMTDLWDPARRAALCASCHIGSVSDGKVITHAMYAAGHPPLPSFEVTTFSDAMPRHWQYLKEKPRAVQELLGFDKTAAEHEQTTLLVVGGLVSLRQSLKLLADQARAGAAWPELARFDCYACHHDLRANSWRQARIGRNRPGRPMLPQWPGVLAELGAAEAADGQAAAGASALRKKLAELDAVFAAQPYGDPDTVAKKADELAEWVDQQLGALRRSKPDAPAPRRLLGRLLELEPKGVHDYDSARQLGWGLRVLQREVDPAAAVRVKQLPSWKALDAFLGLTLPVGRTELLPSLPAALERLNAHQPARVAREFRAAAKEFQRLSEPKASPETAR